MRNVSCPDGRVSSIRQVGGRRGVWGRGVESPSRNFVETPRVPSVNGRDRHRCKRIRDKRTPTGNVGVSSSIDMSKKPLRPQSRGKNTHGGQDGEEAPCRRSPPPLAYATGPTSRAAERQTA